MTALLAKRGVIPDCTAVYDCIARREKDNKLLGILIPDWMMDGKAIEGIPLIDLVAEFGDACMLEPLLDQFNDTSSLSTVTEILFDLAVRGDNESTKALLCSIPSGSNGPFNPQDTTELRQTGQGGSVSVTQHS